MVKSKKFEVSAGIDDATKCPCIGSIFVSGVVADKKTIAYWKKIGVKDSKLIAAKKRNKLATIIKKTALEFSIHEITPAMIDDKIFNLNDWEMLTVFKIVQELQRSSQLNIIYVDNWEVSEKRFRERFSVLLAENSVQHMLHAKNINLDRNILHTLSFISEHRADENYTIVGAASILSKTSSDMQYQEYKKLYGNFGSGSPADPQTRLFVWQHRLNPPSIIRTSWNTYKMLMKLQKIEDDPIYSRALNKKNQLAKSKIL